MSRPVLPPPGQFVPFPLIQPEKQKEKRKLTTMKLCTNQDQGRNTDTNAKSPRITFLSFHMVLFFIFFIYI